MGVHRKIRFLGGVHEKTKIYREDCLKTGTWTVCRFKRRLFEKEGLLFLKEGGGWGGGEGVG